MDETLFQYIRKGQIVKNRKDPETGERKNVIVSKGRVVGVMIAFAEEGKIGIGFSRYCLAKETYFNDKTRCYEQRPKEKIHFNYFIGKKLAFARADMYLSFEDDIPKFCKITPNYVNRQFIKFAERAERYFKGCTLPVWFTFYKSLHN